MLDVAASYPNGGAVLNISRETTVKEICHMPGVREEVLRAQMVNLSGGQTNAVEFCTELLGMPDMDTLLQAFQEEMAQASTSTGVLENPYRDAA